MKFEPPHVITVIGGILAGIGLGFSLAQFEPDPKGRTLQQSYDNREPLVVYVGKDFDFDDGVLDPQNIKLTREGRRFFEKENKVPADIVPFYDLRFITAGQSTIPKLYEAGVYPAEANKFSTAFNIEEVIDLHEGRVTPEYANEGKALGFYSEQIVSAFTRHANISHIRALQLTRANMTFTDSLKLVECGFTPERMRAYSPEFTPDDLCRLDGRVKPEIANLYDPKIGGDGIRTLVDKQIDHKYANEVFALNSRYLATRIDAEDIVIFAEEKLPVSEIERRCKETKLEKAIWQ